MLIELWSAQREGGPHASGWDFRRCTERKNLTPVATLARAREGRTPCLLPPIDVRVCKGRTNPLPVVLRQPVVFVCGRDMASVSQYLQPARIEKTVPVECLYATAYDGRAFRSYAPVDLPRHASCRVNHAAVSYQGVLVQVMALWSGRALGAPVGLMGRVQPSFV